MPNGRQEDTNMAFSLYVVTVTVKTRARGDMLMSRRELQDTLGQGHTRAIG
jgi:hypothetical protein